MTILVVDIGASRLRVGLAPDYKCITVDQAPNEYSALLGGVQEFASHSSRRISSCFVACPGLVNADGRVVNALYSCVSGHDLKVDIEELLQVPVVVRNDATAQALGAYSTGNQLVAYITIGSAVGGAVVHKGLLVSGARGFGGEIGHVHSRYATERCPCGYLGCVDTVASGWSIERDLGRDWYRSSVGQHQHRLRQAGRAIGATCVDIRSLLDVDLIAINGPLAHHVAFVEAVNTELSSDLDLSPIVFSNSAWEYTMRWALHQAEGNKI